MRTLHTTKQKMSVDKPYPYQVFEGLALRDVVDGKLRDWDCPILVVGKEGRGKSTLMLDILQSICKLEGKPEDSSIIAPSLKDFARGLRLSPQSGNLALDEGSELTSLDTLKPLSKAMARAYTVMRAKLLFTLICFVDLRKLQSYFQGRAKAVIYIPKRGLAYFFTNKAIHTHILPELERLKSKDPDILGKKPFSNHRLYSFRYPEYKGALKDQYLTAKHTNIDQILDDLDTAFGNSEPTYSLNKVVKMFGHDNKLTRFLIQAGHIESRKTHAGHCLIKKEEVDKWRKVLDNKENYSKYTNLMLNAHPEWGNRKKSKNVVQNTINNDIMEEKST